MLCSNCGSKMQDHEKFCPQCGKKIEPDHTDTQVKSMEAWKLKKFEEKDQARKQKVESEKEKLESIKERMYRQQAGFDVDQIMTETKKKDDKKKDENNDDKS